VWNDLAGGDGEYCAILVALNSVLQMVLYAPIAVLFVNNIGGNAGTAVVISYSVVARSVAVFLGVPLGAAVLTRFILRKVGGPVWYDTKFVKWASPFSLLGLLFTVVILFASQGRRVVHQIVAVVRVSCPLIVYFALIFSVTLFVCHRFGFGYKLECAQSFTAASNNFELAIAVAVSTFGIDSDQALAATVGPLIEVPVLLGLVYFVRWLGGRRSWKD
jgi:arsenite transporter